MSLRSTVGGGAARAVGGCAAYFARLARHKLVVFRIGVALGAPDMLGPRAIAWPRWIVRLALHDLSRCLPSEWPMATAAIGLPASTALARHRRAKAALVAELQHRHRNAHHWEHWLYVHADGSEQALTMPALQVDLMVCDLVAAAYAAAPTQGLGAAVLAAIDAYRATGSIMRLPITSRARCELQLLTLAGRVAHVALSEPLSPLMRAALPPGFTAGTHRIVGGTLRRAHT